MLGLEIQESYSKCSKFGVSMFEVFNVRYFGVRSTSTFIPNSTHNFFENKSKIFLYISKHTYLKITMRLTKPPSSLFFSDLRGWKAMSLRRYQMWCVDQNQIAQFSHHFSESSCFFVKCGWSLSVSVQTKDFKLLFRSSSSTSLFCGLFGSRTSKYRVSKMDSDNLRRYFSFTFLFVFWCQGFFPCNFYNEKL